MISQTQELDGLRGVAVVIVIFSHFHGMFGFHHGALGVDIFFTLSGFLMTRILLSELRTTSSINLLNFYARRMLRLAPCLVTVVIFVSAFYLAFGISIRTVASFSIPALLYFSNWVRAFDLWNLAALGHTWSLSIEEQFYILWPIILIAANRLIRTEKIVWFCLALAVMIIAHRFSVLDGGATASRISNGFDTRADTILIGAALGAFGSHKTLSFAWLGSAAAIAASFLLFVLVCEPNWYYQTGTTGVAVATACIISNAVGGGNGMINLMLRNECLRLVGKVSYGLYLWHYPIYKLFWMTVGEDSFKPNVLHTLDLFILIPLTYIVSCASYRWIESPALKFKEKFAVRTG